MQEGFQTAEQKVCVVIHEGSLNRTVKAFIMGIHFGEHG